MTSKRTIALSADRALVVHDSGGDGPVVVWHHGTPASGAPPAPLLRAARDRRMRVVSAARPGYGGSTPHPGRTPASHAADLSAVLDALELDRVVALGYSGGAVHALAWGTLEPRIRAVATLGALAPYDGSDDWFDGMRAPGALRAAAAGRAERTAHAAPFDPEQFTDADRAALDGEWRALGADAGAAAAAGSDGEVDDDVALVTAWSASGAGHGGRAPAVLLVHGEDDRIVPVAHARRLAGALPDAELRVLAGDGHVSVLRAVPAALDWLAAHR